MPGVVPGVKRIVAIASGKGGVGKTTVTAHLAVALHMRGLRTGIFDADIYGPNVPEIFGLRSKVTADERWLPAARASTVPYLEPDMRAGFPIVSLGLMVPQTRALRPDPTFLGRLALQTLKDVVWGDVDYLLLDLPPGTGEPQRTLLAGVAIDGFVVVATPSRLAIADAERLVDWVVREGGKVLGVVENMSHLNCPKCGEELRLFGEDVARSEVLREAGILGSVPWLDMPPSIASESASDGGALSFLAEWLESNVPAHDGPAQEVDS